MEPFVGEIKLCAFRFAPAGWALCDGTLLKVRDNIALFSVLGARYGGDGRNTFALPDLRGRTPVHRSLGADKRIPAVVGKGGGAESVTLTLANLAPHNHIVRAAADVASKLNVGAVADRILAASSATALYGAPGVTADQQKAMSVEMCGMAGSKEVAPIGITQPSLVLNYIIALAGLYPPRN